MLTVDVIMPSLSTPEHHQMVRETIATLRKSENVITFNVILVESAKEAVDLGQDQTIMFDLPKFNFHHAINQGLKVSKNDWVVIANNDLIFFEGWMSAILDCKANNPEISSFSPWEPMRHPKHFKTPYETFYEGYKVSVTLAGWCLVTTKDVLGKITLSEEIAHWYSDNNYADELKLHGFRHALVTDSKVHHLEEQTSSKLPNYRELTVGQQRAYEMISKNGVSSMKIDLGCGRKKQEGFFGVDVQELPGVDLVADCNLPIPLPDSCADEIHARDFLEHINNDKRIHIMSEIYRILKPNGVLYSATPSTDGRGAFQDPTHYSFWNENSFRYYTDDGHRNLYGIKPKFETISLYTTPHDRDHVCYVVAILRAIK